MLMICSGKVYHEDMAPQCLQCDRGYLLGHSEGPVGRCHDPQVGAGQADHVSDTFLVFFRTVLLSIQALLAAPEPDDPQVRTYICGSKQWVQ